MTINSFCNFDMQLLHFAAYYELNSKQERNRSVADLERLFFRLYGILSPDLFLDVGASDARTSKRARRRGGNSRIVALEANPLTYEKHMSNSEILAGGIEYLNLAASDFDGETDFLMVVKDGQESDDEKGSLQVRLVDPADVISRKVPTVKLSSLFPNSSFESCCMWIDVEGASGQVLSGAEQILTQTSALYIEVEDREIWKSQWLSHEVVDFLVSRGLVPIARDFQSRYQYNILFVNNDTLLNSRVRFALAEHISRVGQRVST